MYWNCRCEIRHTPQKPCKFPSIKVVMSRIKRLAKESIWIIVGQLSVAVASLILVRVLTEYLAPAQFGQLALGLTVAGLLNQVVMGGIISGIGRFYSVAIEKQDLDGYLRATLHLQGYATGMMVVIVLILMASMSWLGYSQWISLAAAAMVFSVINGYNSSISAIQTAARERAIVSLHGGLDAWLKILLAVGIVFWLGASSTAVVIGYACSSLFVTLSQLIFLRRTIPQLHTPIQDSQKWMQQIWVYSLPFTSWGIFTWMQQVSDRWALDAFSTTSDVGKYAVLFQLGYTPMVLTTGFCTAFIAPILYQRSGDAKDHERNTNVHRITWRITILSLIVTFFAFIITFALHGWLFDILVASDFRGSSYLLPWVVLAGGFFSSGQILSLKLMSEMRPQALVKPKIFTSLIGVLLNVIGAVIAGIQGVVWAVVAFSVIYFVWMTLLALRVLPVRPVAL